MVRCALDLGLRIGEIAKLALADIDWEAGTITLRSTKSRREDILPLPISTGQAIADYLRYVRLRTTNQAVFVRRLAPHDVPISAYTVHRLIRDAYHRIGLGACPRIETKNYSARIPFHSILIQSLKNYS